jgi:hypothetical protein
MGDNINERDGFSFSEQVVDNLRRKEGLASPTPMFGMDSSFNSSSHTPVSLGFFADGSFSTSPLNSRRDNPSSLKESRIKMGFGISPKKMSENIKGDFLMSKRKSASREREGRGKKGERKPEEEKRKYIESLNNGKEVKEEHVNIKLLRSFVSTSGHSYTRNSDERNDDANSSVSPGFSEESWGGGGGLDNDPHSFLRNGKLIHSTDDNASPTCHSAVDRYVYSTSPFSYSSSFSAASPMASPNCLRVVKNPKPGKHNNNNNNNSSSANNNNNKPKSSEGEMSYVNAHSSSFCSSVSNPVSLCCPTYVVGELSSSTNQKHYYKHKRVSSFPLYGQNLVFHFPASVPPTSTSGLFDLKTPSEIKSEV